MQLAERPHFTEDDYVELERRAETKSELVNGEIFAMKGAKPRHNALAVNVAAEIRSRLRSRKSPCIVLDGAEDVVKLIDFGLSKVPVEKLSSVARPGESDRALTASGVIMGTMGYLAPEAALARATPAMRIAYEMRTASCPDRPVLFARAASDGEDRALDTLRSMQAPRCSRQDRCCLPEDREPERAIAEIQARMRR